MKKSVWTFVGVSVFILALLAAAAWSIFDYGRYQAGFSLTEYQKRETAHKENTRQLEKMVDELKSEIVKLQSANQVDLYANQAVKDNLKKMEAEIQVLREELQFYRRIVSPSKGRQGIHIHDFSITQNVDGNYSYRLTLIHIQGTKKHHRESDGNIALSVEGKQGGVNKTLNFASISAEKKSRIRYRFKYFARYEGQLVLPKKFTPLAIEVTVVPRQKNIKGDSKKIEWPTTNG
jgi:hypothetical protein